jgi:hypothetical protein
VRTLTANHDLTIVSAGATGFSKDPSLSFCSLKPAPAKRYCVAASLGRQFVRQTMTLKRSGAYEYPISEWDGFQLRITLSPTLIIVSRFTSSGRCI